MSIRSIPSNRSLTEQRDNAKHQLVSGWVVLPHKRAVVANLGSDGEDDEMEIVPCVTELNAIDFHNQGK